ncbi:MAG: hypothetical protein ACRDRO_14020 [Pseudonocardiaceae bacterium]
MKNEQVMSTLAAALTARVDGVLPDGFRVSATGTIVSLSTPTEEALRDIDISLVLNHVDNLAAAVESAAWQVLNDFQDDVIDYPWEAWPTIEGHTSPAKAYGEKVTKRINALIEDVERHGNDGIGA